MPVSLDDFAASVAEINKALKGLKEISDIGFANLDDRICTLEDNFERVLNSIDDLTRRVIGLECKSAATFFVMADSEEDARQNVERYICRNGI